MSVCQVPPWGLMILLQCAVKLLQDSDRSRSISGYLTCLIIFVIRINLLLLCAEQKHFVYGFLQESMRRNISTRTDFLDNEKISEERNMSEFISETLNEEKLADL